MANLQSSVINSTGALDLPRGTTAQRPGNPQAGMIRFNTDFGWVEYYDSSAWRSYNVGQSPAQAVLDFDQLPPSFAGGPMWINPALATGRGDRPILVETARDRNNELYVKLRNTFINGIASNSYTTDNSVDKVRDEGPNGSGAYTGTIFGLGPNTDLAFNGDSTSTVDNSTRYVTSSDRRRFQLIQYYNFATGTNLSSTEAEDIAVWANKTSDFSYQISLVTDDDDGGFSGFSSNRVYRPQNSSTDETAEDGDSVGHPVLIHSWGSDGSIYGDDGTTNQGGMSVQNDNRGVFLMSRSRGPSSNSVLATRYSTSEQQLFAERGSAEGGTANREFDQNEPMAPDFVMPYAVSLLVHTGGGCAYGYRTYESDDTLTENYFLVRGEGYL